MWDRFKLVRLTECWRLPFELIAQLFRWRRDLLDLMNQRFGYGYEYEKGLSDRPSTKHAQTFFLELVLKVRNDVWLSLQEIAHGRYSEFIAQHKDEINQTGLNVFGFSWSAIQREKTADQLCLALRKWASKWNLTDTWCLNHAVLTLRDQSWQSALWWLQTEPIMTRFILTDELKKMGIFEFVFRFDSLSSSVEGPFSTSPAKFGQEVEESSTAWGGRAIRGARKALNFQMGDYLVRVAEANELLKLTPPPVRWALDHFEWLINYQIAGKTYREIGRAFDKDEATVREGIKDVAKLVGLTLRPASRPGRPKGIKETERRHRVTQN